MKKLICTILAYSLLYTTCWAGKTEELKQLETKIKKAVMGTIVEYQSNNHTPLDITEIHKPIKTIKHGPDMSRVAHTEFDPKNKLMHFLGFNKNSEFTSEIYNILLNKLMTTDKKGYRSPIFNQYDEKYMFHWQGKSPNGKNHVINTTTGDIFAVLNKTKYGIDNMYSFGLQGSRGLALREDFNSCFVFDLKAGSRAYLVQFPSTAEAVHLSPMDQQHALFVLEDNYFLTHNLENKSTKLFEYCHTPLESFSPGWIPKNTRIWFSKSGNLVYSDQLTPDIFITHLINPSTGRTLGVASSSKAPKRVHFIGDSNSIALTFDEDPTLYEWNPLKDPQAKNVKRHKLQEPIRLSITYDKEGKYCMPYGWDGVNQENHYIYNLKNETYVNYKLDEEALQTWPYFYKDHLIVWHFCGETWKIVTFDLHTMKIIATHTSPLSAFGLGISPDGTFFSTTISRNNDSLVRLYKTDEKEPLLEDSIVWPYAQWINNDLVALLTNESCLQIYSCVERKIKYTLNTDNKITSIQLNNDKTVLAISQVSKNDQVTTDLYNLQELIPDLETSDLAKEPAQYFEVRKNQDGTTTYVQDGKEYIVDAKKEMTK